MRILAFLAHSCRGFGAAAGGKGQRGTTRLDRVLCEEKSPPFSGSRRLASDFEKCGPKQSEQLPMMCMHKAQNSTIC